MLRLRTGSARMTRCWSVQMGSSPGASRDHRASRIGTWKRHSSGCWPARPPVEGRKEPMNTRPTTVTLFVAALLSAMALGGSFYEALVVYPAWSASPPASLAVLQGPYAVDSTRFWTLVHVSFEIAL